jgi:TPR repeat protein
MPWLLMLQLGRGVEQHQQLALQLLRAASQMGDAEAQGLMGMRYAYGLHNTASVGVSSVLSFEGVSCQHLRACCTTQPC